MAQDLDALAAKIDDLSQFMLRASPPKVMKPRECAVFIGCTTECLYLWRKAGNGPPFSQPNGKTVYYLLDDVIAWLRAHQG